MRRTGRSACRTASSPPGNQQLTERIKAARENNRFLDTRIARLEADLAESLLAGQRAQPS